MARRNGSINVKLPVKKVIKSLELALDKLEKNYTQQEANEAKFIKTEAKYNAEVGKLAIKHINRATNIKTTVRYNGTINVDFDIPADIIKLPPQPERNFEKLYDWQYKEQKEEISNAIRILKMTDEETVNASTYNAISKYL